MPARRRPRRRRRSGPTPSPWNRTGGWQPEGSRGPCSGDVPSNDGGTGRLAAERFWLHMSRGLQPTPQSDPPRAREGCRGRVGSAPATTSPFSSSFDHLGDTLGHAHHSLICLARVGARDDSHTRRARGLGAVHGVCGLRYPNSPELAHHPPLTLKTENEIVRVLTRRPCPRSLGEPPSTTSVAALRILPGGGTT